MMIRRLVPAMLIVMLVILLATDVLAQLSFRRLPEISHLPVRDVGAFPSATIPTDVRPPRTVSQWDTEVEPEQVNLDDAIRQALSSAQMIRILGASGAASSGISIYDPAIATTRIDQQQAAFDPTVDMRHDFLRNETPFAVPDAAAPLGARIDGTRNDRYDMSVGVTRRTLTGGQANFRVNANRDRTQPGFRLLNPQSGSSATLSATQPLLQGAGLEVNRAPIMLARINTEQSFFRLKDQTQEMVRGVIQGYWDLVSARTRVWAVEQQLQQVQFAVRLEETRKRVGSADLAQLSQARLALASFRSNLVSARGDLLNREAAFRGILGYPPTVATELLPMTAPRTHRLEFDWEGLLAIAERNRPDLIELKLVLEADYQQMLLAQNDQLPQLDAVGLYRWNGIEGELPTQQQLRSGAGDFTDWQLGINFSVPLGFRRARASVREQRLLIARDRANLDQRMLEVVHEVAASLRRIDQQFAQFEAAQQTRIAAFENLGPQFAAYRVGRIEFINVLQGVTEWGNAISTEAAALAQYNVELANLERVTGTILEDHGIRFYEERMAAAGPVGICRTNCCVYPQAGRPGSNAPRYQRSTEPVDERFRADAPSELFDRSRLRRIPPPPPSLLEDAPLPDSSSPNPPSTNLPSLSPLPVDPLPQP